MKNYFVFAIALGGMLWSAAQACAAESVGRPVRILSLSFKNKPLAVIRDLIDTEAAKGVDMVVLPETWRGQNDHSMETLEGETIQTLAALARKHHTYIVSPIDRLDGERRLNSAVLLDREGKVVFIYDKVYPYWAEFDHRHKVEVASKAPVYQADFGKVGLAICFDVNFPEVWKSLADQGAEPVIWPSAYSAGTTLQAHALNHHYYIVTSTGARDCLVYDITGEQLLYQKSKDINVSRITLDLDRGIYHENFNIAKRDKLLREHADDVEQSGYLEREAWFVLRARRPGVSARELARQYGMEELRAYIDRSRKEIDAMRGHAFGEKAEPKQTTHSGGLTTAAAK